mmetsp:Transcript_9309/g.18108  ORF Transcript_9309/g.18108 Transcript_9309/m.18108 type:complete len:379 (+) Transcript_9309:430-1566(+)
MMSAEGSDAKEKLTEMEEDPKKTGQWWEEKPDLEGRTEREVKQWLEDLKQRNDLDFVVDDVACAGDNLAAMTKEDLKDLAGKKAGIIIFNAKEKLKKKGEKRKSISDYERGSEERQSYEFDVAAFFKRVSESSKLADNVSKKAAISLNNRDFTVGKDSFVEFLHRLHEAKEIDGVLEVGAPILAKQGYPSRMLVRDSVEDHIEDTLKLLDNGKRVIHYGTPGYGKSMTGALVVKKKMGKKLIVIQQGGTWYFVPKDFPRACVVKSMYPETMKTYAIAQAEVSGVKTRPIFHLIDPHSQRTTEVIVFGEIAEQLATVSPNTLQLNDKLRSWEKQHGYAMRKVEPHWENEDMKNCYEKCYKNLFTLDEYEKRLYFWGNNP